MAMMVIVLMIVMMMRMRGRAASDKEKLYTSSKEGDEKEDGGARIYDRFQLSPTRSSLIHGCIFIWPSKSKTPS
eukprot:4697724-Pyramimonas_sp.AAC.1